MPLKAKTKSRTWKKRTNKSSFKAKLMKQPTSFNIHRFKRWTTPNNMTLTQRGASIGSFNTSNGYWIAQTNAAIAVPGYYAFSIAFCLADLPDYAEFTALYDQYRIDGVKVKILPVNTSSDNPTSSTYMNGGFIHTAIDYDDYNLVALSEAGINEIRCKPSYKVRNITNNKGINIFLRPRIATPVYGAGAFTQYAQAPRKMFLDCGSPSTQHYGIKGLLEVVQYNTVSVYMPFKIECCYYMTFKGVQ